MQKALSVIYKDKYQAYSPSHWNENELLLRELYDHAFIRLATAANKSNIVDDKANTLAGAAKRDLNYFLYRHKYLDRISETPEVVEGTSLPIRTYRSKGLFITEVPDKLDFQSEIERKFIDEVNLFIHRIRFLETLLCEFQGESFQAQEATLSEIDSLVAKVANWGVRVPQWPSFLQSTKRSEKAIHLTHTFEKRLKKLLKSAIQAREAINTNSMTLLAGIMKEALPELGL